MLRAVGIDLWTLYGLGVYSAKMSWVGNSLAVQGLGFCAFAAKGAGSIPGWGTKILQAVQPQKKKKRFSQIRSAVGQCVGEMRRYRGW